MTRVYQVFGLAASIAAILWLGINIGRWTAERGEPDYPEAMPPEIGDITRAPAEPGPLARPVEEADLEIVEPERPFRPAAPTVAEESPDEEQPEPAQPQGPKWRYLVDLEDYERDGWYSPGRPVSFPGSSAYEAGMYANSFLSSYRQSEATWDLNHLRDQGAPLPQRLTTTFGVETSSPQDAAFEIEVFGNQESLYKTRVSLTQPADVEVQLDGACRLEIRANRLSDDGDVVMIEPRIHF